LGRDVQTDLLKENKVGVESRRFKGKTGGCLRLIKKRLLFIGSKKNEKTGIGNVVMKKILS